MRKYDFTNSFSEYFSLNKDFNTRDTIAVGRTFSGLAKLIYPDEQMSKEEVREILEYAIECRRRVKEQLRKMTPGEFSDVNLGYIDLDTNEEHVVELPEVSSGTLIFQSFEKPGYVYGIGRSVSDVLGVYRLENKLVDGTGSFSFKNVEGLAKSPKSVRDSLNAAFNYFHEHSGELVSGSTEDFDSENLHITLAFIGEFGDPDQVMDVIETVRFRPFTITMDRLGQFDKLWWTGLSRCPELDILAHNVRYALAENGIPFDRKRFQPHITVLRKSEYDLGDMEPVYVAPASMWVDNFSLMQSTRGKNGMIYTELGSVPVSEGVDP